VRRRREGASRVGREGGSTGLFEARAGCPSVGQGNAWKQPV
jgi:hypothetical protein